MIAQATKTKKQITAAALFRCYAKEDTLKQHCIGYGVPSDKEGTYSVTWNYELHRYECTCKDHIERQHNCKHIDAVIEVCQVRNAPSHEQAGALPQETRQRVYNWSQSQAGDAMEREYNEQAENAACYRRMMASEY